MAAPPRLPNRLRGIPWLTKSGDVSSQGNIYWVSSTSTNRGDTTSNGRDPDYPFATLDYAIGLCEANNGDVIYLMENHAETITAADGADFDVAGITVIGLGEGDDRPTFTFTTSTAADIEIDAANTKIQNCLFVCSIASQVHMISLTANADGAVLKNCEFREGTATGLSMVEWTGAADNVLIEDCRFYAPTAGNYDEAILIADTPTRGRIINCSIWGDFDEGGINNATSNVATNFEIRDCRVTNLLTNVPAINLDSACTGIIANCQLATDTAASALDPGSMAVVNVFWHSPGSDTSSVPALPLADSATNFIGVDDADNLAATSNVVANRDGSVLERLEHILDCVLDDETSNALGVDDADNAFASSNVVANRDGSILERLEHILDCVVDDETTNALGVDDADNAFASTNVVANRDGSILERLEALMDPLGAYVPGLGYRVTKTSNLADGAGTDDLFTVTGSVVVNLLVGEVTTVVGGAATMKLRDTTNSVDLCTATTIDNDADGTMYLFSGVASEALNSGVSPVIGVAYKTTGGITPVVLGNVGGSSTISHVLDAADTGAVLWTMYFMPLSANATVVAAA